MVTETYVPTGLIKRQAKERVILEQLYSILEQAQEKETGVNALAKEVSVSYSVMNKITLDMERAGILTRRSTWTGDSPGRKTFWTLLLTKEEAIKAIEEYQFVEVEKLKGNRSLKSRMLQAILEQGKFDSVLDILEYIRKPNENIDLHNMTHVLNSLKQQGQVSFKRDAHGKGRNRISNDKVPYNIIYTGKQMTKQEASALQRALPVYNSPEQAEVAPVVVDTPKPEPAPVAIFGALSDEFPLIARLAHRREYLGKAAELADNANETEIALELLAKAQKDDSPYNEEVIRLWNEHLKCKMQ